MTASVVLGIEFKIQADNHAGSGNTEARLFDQQVWPVAETLLDAVSRTHTSAKVDVAAKFKAMWR